MPTLANSTTKIGNNSDQQKRCTTPVTVTFFGHNNDSGRLEKVLLNQQQPLSLPSTNMDSLESDSNLSSPTNPSNPFVTLMESTNPFQGINPFIDSGGVNNPFRGQEVVETGNEVDESIKVGHRGRCICNVLFCV